MKFYEQELQSLWPQFTHFFSKPSMRIWSWKVAPTLVFFITVQVREREDQFTIEIAWNETDEFPWRPIAELNVDQSQGRERLSLLWEGGKDEQFWDLAPEVTAAWAQALENARNGKGWGATPPDPPLELVLPRVQPAVQDAIGKLKEHGGKLFRQVAEAHGVEVGDRL
jgi:hypothetical protein